MSSTPPAPIDPAAQPLQPDAAAQSADPVSQADPAAQAAAPVSPAPAGDAAQPEVQDTAPAAETADKASDKTADNTPAKASESPAAVGAGLAERFPALFKGQPKPLKLRIQADIQERAPGVFSKQGLSGFLRRYTGTTPYLIAVSKGQQRFDLDGQPAGELSEEHRQVATEELARRRSITQARREQEEQARKARAELLREFEAAQQSEAEFSAAKSLTPEDLASQLAQARTEAQEEAQRPRRPEHGRGGRGQGQGPRGDQRGGQAREGRAGPGGSRREGGGRGAGDRAPNQAARSGPRPERQAPAGEQGPRVEADQAVAGTPAEQSRHKPRHHDGQPRGDRRGGEGRAAVGPAQGQGPERAQERGQGPRPPRRGGERAEHGGERRPREGGPRHPHPGSGGGRPASDKPLNTAMAQAFQKAKTGGRED